MKKKRLPNKTSFKKGEHFSLKTEFKKGQIAHNKLPIGTIVIRQPKKEKPRRWIKIAEPNKWEEYYKFVYKGKNGEIPKGYLVHHIDFNQLNDNINNLLLTTRKNHFEIHKIGQIGRDSRLKKYGK